MKDVVLSAEASHNPTILGRYLEKDKQCTIQEDDDGDVNDKLS